MSMGDAKEEHKSRDELSEGKMSGKTVETPEKEQELLDRLKEIQKENFALRSSIKALKTAIQTQKEECNETEHKLEEIYREIWTEREKFCEKADEFNKEYGVLSDWWQTQLNLVWDLENGGISRDEEMKRMEALEMDIEELQEKKIEEEKNGEEMEVQLDAGEAAIVEMLPTSESDILKKMSPISKSKEFDERMLSDLEFLVGEIEKKEGLPTSECNSEQVFKPKEKSKSNVEFTTKETNQMLPTSESNGETVLPTFEFKSELHVTNREKVMPTVIDQEMLPTSEFPSGETEIKKKKGLPTSKKSISPTFKTKTTSKEQQMLPTFGYNSENIMDGQTMSPTFEFHSESNVKNAGKVSTTLKSKQTIPYDQRMLPTFQFKSEQTNIENKNKLPTLKCNPEGNILHEERLLPTYESGSASDAKNRQKMMPTLISKLDDQRLLPTYEFGTKKTDTERYKGLPTSNCNFEQNLIDGENIWPTFEFDSESRAINNEKMVPPLKSKQNTFDEQRMLPTSELYFESSAINNEKMIPTLKPKPTLANHNTLPTFEYQTKLKKSTGLPTSNGNNTSVQTPPSLPTFEPLEPSSLSHSVLFSMVDVRQVREATRKFNSRKSLVGKFKKLTTC